jgi:hypothetical protein
VRPISLPHPEEPALAMMRHFRLPLDCNAEQHRTCSRSNSGAEARIVTRWRSLAGPGEVFAQRIEWHAAGMPAPLAIDLEPLFAEALD